MRALLRSTLDAAVVPLLGCADRQPTTPPPPQDVAGFWTGTIQQGLQGGNSFPTVILSLRSGGAQFQTDLVYFRGEFTGVDRISARLIGGGFNHERVELRRTIRPTATTR
jgi:hypothetical protein